jgi:creatinine amidohydrolase
LAEKAFVLFDMSWPEVRENLSTIKVAIIPTGSCEQHGPNGTFEVDTARAYEVAKMLAARTWPVSIAAPPVLYGISSHHMNFPGTVTLRPETFIAVCLDVVDSLYQHGVRKFLFVNGHGGNVGALRVVLATIRDSYDDAAAAMASPTQVAADVVAQKVKSPITGHACESEISQCLYVAPRAVKLDALQKGAVKLTVDEFKNPWGIEIARKWDEVSENGALGDATQSSRETGEAIIETAVERLAAFINDFSAR